MTMVTNNNLATTNVQKSNQFISYNSFLNLFMTELKNQDPTSPMDTSQTLTQLATFSSVEESVNSNNTLNSILNSINQLESSNLVGKNISSIDGTISGVVSSVQFNTDNTQFVQFANGSQMNLSNGYKVTL